MCIRDRIMFGYVRLHSLERCIPRTYAVQTYITSIIVRFILSLCPCRNVSSSFARLLYSTVHRRCARARTAAIVLPQVEQHRLAVGAMPYLRICGRVSNGGGGGSAPRIHAAPRRAHLFPIRFLISPLLHPLLWSTLLALHTNSTVTN